MDLLRAMKEINETPTSLVLALLNDLLVDIVGKVATFSMADFCKIKLSFKDFLNAFVDRYVYQHASLDKFSPLKWKLHFLDVVGKVVIWRFFIVKELMVQYFCTLMVILGFENLKRLH
jgi:hypothetical protein